MEAIRGSLLRLIWVWFDGELKLKLPCRARMRAMKYFFLTIYDSEPFHAERNAWRVKVFNFLSFMKTVKTAMVLG